MSIKRELYKACQSLLRERMVRVQKNIADIEASLNSETKSTAGDKHETGRAMLHLEREKAGTQLKELEKKRAIINRIQPETVMVKPALGSVVFTSMGNYFIAISGGEIKIKDQTYYAISFNSPIGQLLKGKGEGEAFYFRNTKVRIIKIL